MKSQKIQLEKEYIESNTPASVYTSLHDLTGVTVPETKQYAYIVGYDISYLCDIKPLFKKINKDGSVVIELVQGHEAGRSRNS